MSRMDCIWIARDEVFEQYVRDALGPDDRDAFEEHFFTCEACFDKLQTYRALQVELGGSAAEVLAPEIARARVWRWAFVPVAAGLVLVAALALWLRSSAPAVPESTVAVAPAPQPAAAVPPAAAQPQPTPAERQPGQPAPTMGRRQQPASPPVFALSVLARVEPPIYIPVALRGPRDDAAERFEPAMQRYLEGDYAGAIPGLRAAADLSPNAPHVTFFLAVCQMLTGQLEPAVSGLQRTIALGESAYLEEAHFYLAKARLRQGDIQAARDELRLTMALRGRLEADARRLLTQLDSLPPGRDRPPRN